MTDDATDRIFLRGLAVECVIGFIEWERRIKQTVVIDLEMPVDCARAAQHDAAHAVVGFERADDLAQPHPHRLGERVELVRVGQNDAGDRAVALQQHGRCTHSGVRSIRYAALRVPLAAPAHSAR